MVELALHNQLDNVFIEDFGHTKRIHLGLNHSAQDIQSSLSYELQEQLLEQAKSLMSNDNQARHFIRENDFVIIRAVH